MSELKGKVAIITGSSSGIGEAIAIKLSQLGVNVVITGRDQNRIEKVVQKCRALDSNLKCIGIRAELMNDEDIKQLVDKTVQEFGRIDILVANVGIVKMDTINSPDYIPGFDETFALKVRSINILAKLAIPYLMDSKGNFININGIHTIKPNCQLMALCMAQSAMDIFTKCLALEMGPKGVRCNSVVASIMRIPSMVPLIERSVDYWKQNLPIKRIGEPEDVANLVAFLVSTEASFITGATIPVDGGYLVAPMPELKL